MDIIIFSSFKQFQKQNVERAKLALLTDKLEGLSDLNDSSTQSDHLVLMVAYKKWQRILLKVSCFICYNFESRYILKVL